MIDSTTPSPTPRIPARPKRIPSGTAVKSLPEELTSGGRTVMPARLHSATYFTILSVLP